MATGANGPAVDPEGGSPPSTPSSGRSPLRLDRAGPADFPDRAQGALDFGKAPSTPEVSIVALQPEELLLRTRNGSETDLAFHARQRVYRVVLTGGPCAGKSSAAAVLQEQLSSHGFLVFTLPEVATMMFNAGANWLQFAETDQGLNLYQSNLAKLQLAHEDSFMRLGHGTGKPCVVICDRGLMDGKAYSSPAVWQAVLRNTGLSEAQMLARYDAVAFMVTAADGAEPFYTKDNNAARRETAAEAVDIDRRLRGCWAAHQHLGVFDNRYATFKEKIAAVVNFVLRTVAGANLPRRFVLPYASLEECKRCLPAGVPHLDQTIESVISTSCVLKIVASQSQVRHYVQEQKLVGNVVVERTSKVLPEVFEKYRLLAEQEGARSTVSTLCHFTYRSLLWEVHYSQSSKCLVLQTYTDPARDLGPFLPPFLEVGLELGGLYGIGPPVPMATDII